MSELDHLRPWLSPNQVAEHAGKHPVTVRKLLESGELHGHQRCHRGRWRVHVDAVDAWIRGDRDLTAACGCTRLRRAR